MDNERRNGHFSYAPEDGRLVVGEHEAVVGPEPGAVAVISTYLDLVASQRSAMPTERIQLRDHELDSLARLLALPPDELAALIDAELHKLLAVEGDEDAVAATARRRWVLLLAAVIGLGAATGTAVLAAAASSSGARDDGSGTTVEIVQLDDGSTATRTESAPVPPTEDTDIGSAVTYERNE